MLVVAADDGPRAQTLEHLELLDALGIADGLAVVTKADAVDAGAGGRGGRRVRALLDRTSLARRAGRRRVRRRPATGSTSSATALVDARDRVVAPGPARRPGPAGDRPRVRRPGPRDRRHRHASAADRSAADARLRLVPGGGDGPRPRAPGPRPDVDELADGGRTALNLGGVDAADIQRGMVLPVDGPHGRPGRRRNGPAARRAPPGRRRLRRGLRRVLRPIGRGSGSMSAPARSAAVVGRSGRDAVALPGGEVGRDPAPRARRSPSRRRRFVLRRPSPGATLAGGRVLDAEPPRGVSRRRIDAGAAGGARRGRARSEAWLAPGSTCTGAVAAHPAAARGRSRHGCRTDVVGDRRAGARAGLAAPSLRTRAARAPPAGHAGTRPPPRRFASRDRRPRPRGPAGADGDRLARPGRARRPAPRRSSLAAMDRLERRSTLPRRRPSPRPRARAGCPPARDPRARAARGSSCSTTTSPTRRRVPRGSSARRSSWPRGAARRRPRCATRPGRAAST